MTNSISKNSTRAAGMAAVAGIMLQFAMVPGFAADSGSPTVVTCEKGKIWDQKKKKCVKIKKSSSLSDDNLYGAARDLAYHGRYEEAQQVLKMASNQNDARILTYMGFTTRKLGSVEDGMPYYQAALAVDPNFAPTREYLGEAYLQLGEVDKAREQLAELAVRCGTDCAEYAMLKSEIEKAVR